MTDTLKHKLICAFAEKIKKETGQAETYAFCLAGDLYALLEAAQVEQPTLPMTDDVRAAFEKANTPKYGRVNFWMGKRDNGDYRHPDTQAKWLEFQAKAAPPVPTIRDFQSVQFDSEQAQPSLQQSEADRPDEAVMLHLSRDLIAALKRLSFAAQTTGGTVGPDAELQAAIAQAEQALSLGAVASAVNAVENARDRFEKWTVNGGRSLTHVFSLARHPNQERYLEGATELCWLAWRDCVGVSQPSLQKPQRLVIDLNEDDSLKLYDYIGEGERPVSLIVSDGRCGYGLYVFDTEYPDEAAEFICAMNRPVNIAQPVAPDLRKVAEAVREAARKICFDWHRRHNEQTTVAIRAIDIDAIIESVRGK